MEKYIAASGRLHYAGGGRLWLVDPACGRVLEVPEEAGLILRAADRFRTLQDHRRALLELGWQDEGGGTLDALLSSLVRSGALRSHSEALRRIQEAPTEHPPPPIEAITWLTRDRPALLRRSVESAIANLRRYGRRAELRVYDDSAAVEARRDTRAMLAELGRREGFAVFYAGAEEKREFAAALQARAGGVSAETIEFALFDPLGVGYTPGANANAELLDTCGKLFLHADDDTVFRFAASPEAETGLRFSSVADPTEVRFFASAREREAAVELRDADILGDHEAWLGRTVADCLRCNEAAADFDPASPEFLPQLAGGARVAATMAGACGDSGLGSPLFVLLLTGASRREAMASNDSYRLARRTREIQRAAPRLTISQGAFLMSMNCGLDNRLHLPPFLPVLRNADGLFGQLLRAAFPRCLIAHLPEALLHLPGEIRLFAEQSSVQPRLTDLLLLLVRSLAPAPWIANPGRAVLQMGSGLAEAGGLEPMRFQEILRGLWAEEMSRQATMLEQQLLEHHEEPKDWAADAEKWFERTRRCITGQEPLVPADLAAGAQDSLGLAQRVVHGYGELLIAWPVLREKAVQLASAGRAIARPV